MLLHFRHTGPSEIALRLQDVEPSRHAPEIAPSFFGVPAFRAPPEIAPAFPAYGPSEIALRL
jgi:hypothetical protein